jgi:hypothetical protein
MDLALRFIALRDVDPKDVGDVHDFLRERMEQLATDKKFKLANEAKLFKEVFQFLDETVDGNAFRPWNSTLKMFRGAFSLGAFEGLALALGRHWPSIKKVRRQFELLNVIKRLWGTQEYKKSFSGLRARERMVRVTPAAELVVTDELLRLGVKVAPKLLVDAGASSKSTSSRPKKSVQKAVKKAAKRGRAAASR